MNFLAHAYLSFGNNDWIVGNLISDYVKGSRRYDYSNGVQQGISIHRAIDEFTDFHPVVKEAKTIFRPDYRLYAGAFVDVVFDHFLALDPTIFKEAGDLELFTLQTYQAVLPHKQMLPANINTMLDRMAAQNWLYHYRWPEGMQQSFRGLVWRSKYLQDSSTAFALFQAHYADLEQYYTAFFPELVAFTKNYILQNIP